MEMALQRIDMKSLKIVYLASVKLGSGREIRDKAVIGELSKNLEGFFWQKLTRLMGTR